MFKIGSSILHNKSLLLQGNFEELDELGGVYIKFLQIVILNLDLHAQENYRALLSVYEGSKPDKLDIVQHMRHQAGFDLSRFASIEPNPIATGSFGQVYKAQLISGERVIIKVLRPSVVKYLRYDLSLLRLLCYSYSLVDSQRMLDFKAIYRELRKTCLQETDYLHEAEAASRYYEAYKNHPSLVIPKTFREFSSQMIIVQEYIDGLSLTEVLAHDTSGKGGPSFVMAQTGSDIFSQLYVIGFELLSRAVTGDIVQADPHPGNIILLPNNKVALIDFGMMTELTQNRTAFYEVLIQYRAFYTGQLSIENFSIATLKYLSPKLYAALQEADGLFGVRSFGSRKILLEKLRTVTREVSQDEYTAPLIESFLQRKMIMKALFFAINNGNRFGFTFDLSSIMLLKAAQGYMSLMGKFDSEGVIVGQVISDVVGFAHDNLELVVDTSVQSLRPGEAMEILSVWFDKMARNDPVLVNKLVGGYLR